MMKDQNVGWNDIVIVDEAFVYIYRDEREESESLPAGAPPLFLCHRELCHDETNDGLAPADFALYATTHSGVVMLYVA